MVAYPRQLLAEIAVVGLVHIDHVRTLPVALFVILYQANDVAKHVRSPAAFCVLSLWAFDLPEELRSNAHAKHGQLHNSLKTLGRRPNQGAYGGGERHTTHDGPAVSRQSGLPTYVREGGGCGIKPGFEFAPAR